MTYATHADHADHAAGGASLWQRLSDLTTGFSQRQAQHRAYRSTVRELSALSQRDLLDMGIQPADIHAVARQAAYGA